MKPTVVISMRVIRGLGVTALVCLTGCAQIWGFDDLNHSADGGAVAPE